MRFVNRYLTKDDIINYLAASDIYITPYINPHQICSGTLAYAVAAGGAIMSTAYLHARFLLGGGRGLLVDFASAESISEAALRVLDAPGLQVDLERRARAYCRRLLWTEVGARYRSLLNDILSQRPRMQRRVSATRTVVAPAAPSVAGSPVQ